MEIFGIELTPGHLIIGGLLVVLYDAIWSFAFPNHMSNWWFERLQGLLKIGIYTGFMAFVILVSQTPWPYNLLLVTMTGIAIWSTLTWLRNRNFGKLTIIIVGLNASLSANVVVTGPNVRHDVHWTRNLTLPAGAYTITMGDVTSGSTIYHPSATSATVTVEKNRTATATVTYS